MAVTCGNGLRYLAKIGETQDFVLPVIRTTITAIKGVKTMLPTGNRRNIRRSSYLPWLPQKRT